MGRKEARVLTDGYRKIEPLLPLFQHFAHAPFASFGNPDRRRRVALDRAGHFAGKAAIIIGIVQHDIVDRPAAIAQRFGMVAHGRQDIGELGLVMTDIFRLVDHFHHQDDAVFRLHAV